MRTFTMMNSYLITRHFILTNKMSNVSRQNGMQRFKWYAKAMQNSKNSMTSQTLS